MSSKIEALLEFYPRVLLDVGVFDENGDGLLSYRDNGRVKPVTISKKRLVLPTKEICREGDWDHRVAFHPLAEQINQGPSVVLNAFKNYVSERITQTVRLIAPALLELAADSKRHKALSSKASKFLTGLVDADQKSVDTLNKVFNEISDKPEKRLITIFLKNGGDGNALRTCMVSFPIMDDAASEDTTTFFGVKMPRKTKDKQLIVAVLEYILGNEEERQQYSAPVTGGDAPYFHSLLLSFKKLAERLNGLIALHGAACQNIVGHQFELEWAETMENFEEFARVNGIAVPALPGNSGKANDEVLEAEKSNKFEVDESKLGVVATPADLDLPWNERPEDRERRLGKPDRDADDVPHGSWRNRDRDTRSNHDRDDRDDRRDTRREESKPGVRRLADVIGGARRDDRDSRDGRDRDRGRDDRGGRGRSRW